MSQKLSNTGNVWWLNIYSDVHLLKFLGSDWRVQGIISRSSNTWRIYHKEELLIAAIYSYCQQYIHINPENRNSMKAWKQKFISSFIYRALPTCARHTVCLWQRTWPCSHRVYHLMGQIWAQWKRQQCSELSKNTKDIRKEALREVKIGGNFIIHYYLH